MISNHSIGLCFLSSYSTLTISLIPIFACTRRSEFLYKRTRLLLPLSVLPKPSPNASLKNQYQKKGSQPADRLTYENFD
jgi:hypothetical protein